MTNKNNKMTSKLLAIPVMAVLLTMTIATVAPDAFAHSCNVSGQHCYANYQKDVDNRGGYGTIDINLGNSVETGGAIVNAVWIKFSNNEWIEGGWQKGSPMSPCSDTDANLYWYETVGNTSSQCIGDVNGSTVFVKITDSDTNDTYKFYVDGVYEGAVTDTRDAKDMHVGGESTDEDNSLDGGEVTGIVYYGTNGTPYWWGSSNLSYSNHLHNYDYDDSSPYNDFQYWGP